MAVCVCVHTATAETNVMRSSHGTSAIPTLVLIMNIVFPIQRRPPVINASNVLVSVYKLCRYIYMYLPIVYVCLQVLLFHTGNVFFGSTTFNLGSVEDDGLDIWIVELVAATTGVFTLAFVCTIIICL